VGRRRPPSSSRQGRGQALEFNIVNDADALAGCNWASTGLTEVSTCTHLRFWCKVQGEKKPEAISVVLCCGPS